LLGHVTQLGEGENRNAHKILDGRSRGKRPLTSPSRRWEDNIKIYVEETEWETVTCFKFAEVLMSGGVLRT
jgi:hypothetical protein